MSLFRFTRVVTVLMICFALGSCGSSARSSNSSNPSSCWLKCSITNPHSLRFGISTAQFSLGNYLGVPNYASVKQSIVDKALKELKGSRTLFVHLYLGWKGGLTSTFVKEVNQLTNEGFSIDLALRYIPSTISVEDPIQFGIWVESVIKALPQVGVFQVTNETNVNTTADSDGYYKYALEALADGVASAHRVKKSNQLIGFNWAYTGLNESSQQFWMTLRKLDPLIGNEIDFAGVDLYPGTYNPPPSSTNIGGDIKSELASMRDLMDLAGFKSSIPIFIQEIGWPSINSTLYKNNHISIKSSFASKFIENFFGKDLYDRTPKTQANILKEMIASTAGFNVRLFEWFDLVDADNGLGDGWGLVSPNGNEKPAFKVFASAISNS